jgi:tetratricopeptide (TPR) repeat protein
MRSRGRFALLLVASALCFAFAAPARAQSMKKGAKVYFERGATEYNLGHFTEAITQFEKAYEIDPAPILLFNIGQCHRQTGNKERALFFYRRYLEQNPKADNRNDVENRMAELERSIKEEKDLQQRPPTNLAAPPAKTEPGPASEMPAPQETTPAAAPGPTATASAPPSSAPTGPAAVVATAPAPASSEPINVRHAAMWSAAGVGGLGLLIGIVETAVWRGKVSSFDSHTGPSATVPTLTVKNCGADDPNRGGPGCSDLYDSAVKARNVAIVGYVVGVLAGAGAAVLYLTDPAAEKKTGVAFRCGPGVGDLGVTCGGSF